MYWPARYGGNRELSAPTRRKRDRVSESLCHSTIRPDFISAMVFKTLFGKSRFGVGLRSQCVQFGALLQQAHACVPAQGGVVVPRRAQRPRLLVVVERLDEPPRRKTLVRAVPKLRLDPALA